jgi:hypothetical protein
MNDEIAKVHENLEKISIYNGRLYGRAFNLFDAEDEYKKECVKFEGFFIISDSFKCFNLESIELFNIKCVPLMTSQISFAYSLFISRIVSTFKLLCSAERIAIHGYPTQACAFLRNVFDNLVLISAASQRITTFEKIDGLTKEPNTDLKNSKTLRIKTEREIRRIMTGNDSGLSPKTLEHLELINNLYDIEVHSGGITRLEDIPWIKGEKPLPILPKFQERSFSMFMNRYFEVIWMYHRLLPLLQPKNLNFGKKWNEEWQIIDDSLKKAQESFTIQMGSEMGAAIVEFITLKFPFTQDSRLPL